jgi:hypothetical protein
MSWSGTLPPGTPGWIQTYSSTLTGGKSKLDNSGSTTSPFYAYYPYNPSTQSIQFSHSPAVAPKWLSGHSSEDPYEFSAQAFLVSAVQNPGQSTYSITVYGGADWGWDGYFTPTWHPPNPSHLPAGVTLWTLNDVKMTGIFGTATATGFFETGSCGSSCNSNIRVTENGTYNYALSGPVNGVAWTTPSQLPESCILGCAGEAPFFADLVVAWAFQTPESAAMFSWEDAGEIFSAESGYITGVTGGASLVARLDATRFVSAAVPELSTWTLMLSGFTGLGFVRRRASSRAGAAKVSGRS